MGIFENFLFLLLTTILGYIVCCLLINFLLNFIINRFKIWKNETKTFYECGFKPISQKPITLSMQFFLLCLLFILFDTDLLFLYPYVTLNSSYSIINLFLFIILHLFLIITWVIDYNNYGFEWKY